MLTKLKIASFKSCTDAVLDALGPVTVLVGRNGAGKSNILQAIEWLAKIASLQLQFRVFPRDSYDVTAEFNAGGLAYRYSASADWNWESGTGTIESDIAISERLGFLDSNGQEQQILSRSNEDIIVSGRPEQIQIKQTATCLPSLMSLLPKDDPLLPKIRPVVSFFSAVRYYPLDETTASRRDSRGDFISEESYVKWRSDVDVSGRPTDDVHLKLLHMHLEQQDKFTELKSLLGHNGLGLIDNIVVHQFFQGTKPTKAESASSFYHLQFFPSAALEGTGFVYNDLSHGTRRILRMLVSMLFDNATVMLVEHPEDGIHPGLLNKVMPVLREYTVPAQEIIASHSTGLFDALEPSAFRLVSMTDGITSIRSLSATELDAAARYVNDDGPLSDFLETIQDG